MILNSWSAFIGKATPSPYSCALRKQKNTSREKMNDGSPLSKYSLSLQ